MSLLDIDEIIEDRNIEVEEWLNQICTYNGLKPILCKDNNTINMVCTEEFIMDSALFINQNIEYISSDFKFGRVEGSFICSNCKLRNCNNFPNEIYGELKIKNCQNMQEIPKFNKLGSLHCQFLPNLEIINKLPNHICGIIEFLECPNIKNLNWFPHHVDGNVWLDSQYKNTEIEKTIRMYIYGDLFWVNSDGSWWTKSKRFDKNI